MDLQLAYQTLAKCHVKKIRYLNDPKRRANWIDCRARD